MASPGHTFFTATSRLHLSLSFGANYFNRQTGDATASQESAFSTAVCTCLPTCVPSLSSVTQYDISSIHTRLTPVPPPATHWAPAPETRVQFPYELKCVFYLLFTAAASFCSRQQQQCWFFARGTWAFTLITFLLYFLFVSVQKENSHICEQEVMIGNFRNLYATFEFI